MSQNQKYGKNGVPDLKKNHNFIIRKRTYFIFCSIKLLLMLGISKFQKLESIKF